MLPRPLWLTWTTVTMLAFPARGCSSTIERAGLPAAQIVSFSYRWGQLAGTHVNSTTLSSPKPLVTIHTFISNGERVAGQGPGPLCMTARLKFIYLLLYFGEIGSPATSQRQKVSLPDRVSCPPIYWQHRQRSCSMETLVKFTQKTIKQKGRVQNTLYKN